MFYGNLYNCMDIPWFTPVTFQVCKILHAFIALKQQIVVPSTVGCYGNCCIHCLLSDTFLGDTHYIHFNPHDMLNTLSY